MLGWFPAYNRSSKSGSGRMEELNTITKDELIEFYKKHISESSPERRKLSVYVVSTAEGGAGREETDQEVSKANEKIEKEHVIITDLVDFKARRPLYPHPAPFANIPRKGAHCKL